MVIRQRLGIFINNIAPDSNVTATIICHSGINHAAARRRTLTRMLLLRIHNTIRLICLYCFIAQRTPIQQKDLYLIYELYRVKSVISDSYLKTPTN